MRNRICEVMALDSVTASYDETSLYRRDCHDPPPAAGRGSGGDRSPPRRLGELARSDVRGRPPAGVIFPRDAIPKRRLPSVVKTVRLFRQPGDVFSGRDRLGEDWDFVRGNSAPARLCMVKIERVDFMFAWEQKDSCDPWYQIQSLIAGQGPGKGCAYGKYSRSTS